MTYELQVDTENLRRAGRGYTTGAGSLKQIQDRLNAAISAEGKCWGGDTTGQEFEKNYLKPSQDIVKLFGELVKGLGEVRKGVDQMAKQYDAAEDAATIKGA